MTISAVEGRSSLSSSRGWNAGAFIGKWSGYYFSLEAGLWSILITVRSWKKSNTTFICGWILKPCTDGFKMTKPCNVPSFKQHKRRIQEDFWWSFALVWGYCYPYCGCRGQNTWRNCGDHSMLVAILVLRDLLPMMWATHSFPTLNALPIGRSQMSSRLMRIKRSILQSSPVENSIEGSVHETLDYLFHQGTIQASCRSGLSHQATALGG